MRAAENVQWVLEGDRGISYSETVPDGSVVVEGSWWGPAYSGPPLVSLEAEVARGLGLKVGDSVTVNVAGRNLTAKIANLRGVNWRSLGINFVFVFSPNTFAAAPHSFLATATFANGGDTAKELALLRMSRRNFRPVTSLRVKDALDAIAGVMNQLRLRGARRVRRGVDRLGLVLAGALAAGQRSRIYDAVVLKTLGATRRRLLYALVIEYALLGLSTALFGLACRHPRGLVRARQSHAPRRVRLALGAGPERDRHRPAGDCRTWLVGYVARPRPEAGRSPEDSLICERVTRSRRPRIRGLVAPRKAIHIVTRQRSDLHRRNRLRNLRGTMSDFDRNASLPWRTGVARAGAAEYDQGLRSYMLGIYNLMTLALGVSALVAVGIFMMGKTSPVVQALYMSPLKWVVMLAPLGFVFFLSFRFERMSIGPAGDFLAFAATMGLSMGSIGFVFKVGSIVQALFATTAAFGALSLYGYTTKRSLSGMGSFLVMGLFGLIIASLINVFVGSGIFGFAISLIGVLIFAGLTAWDTQRLKEEYDVVAGSTRISAKASVMGALTLYLNFINMFQMILSLTGQRND